MLAVYRKGVTAAVGVALLLVNRHLGLDLSGQEQALIDVVLGILTVTGVVQLANKPAD